MEKTDTNSSEHSRGSGCGSVGRAVASIPEVCGSNPDTVNFYRTLIYCQLYTIEKKKIKEKESGNGPFFKKHSSERLP